MRIKPFLFVILVLCVAACTESKNEVLLLNEGWKFSQTDTIAWMPASVPGCIQTDLLNQNKIPHPFIGNNEDSIQWVAKKSWQYKKSFTISENLLKKQKHILLFRGLDTYAKVFLNDSLILSANNAFRTWEIDISEAIKSENEIWILFQPTDYVEKIKAAKLSYNLPESPRVFSRKPQFQYGWDWGPKIKTMGIWRNVSLVSYNKLRFKDVFLQTKKITDTLAEVTANLNIETMTPQEVKVKITNQNTGEAFDYSVDVSPQQLEYEIPLLIVNPKLWWTHNLGEPFMYDINIDLELNGSVIDSYNKKLGIRSIELVNQKDTIGESFYFKLNGKPVYMKGANYIPQNIFLSEVKENQYNQILNDVVDANMNMLRVWGGGIYEESIFYEMCDAKGILIWQDFMFACAMYPGDTNFLENVKQEAIDNVKRLRQHPSIALWCGNNENSEGWNRWGWQDDKTEAQKQEIWSHYQSVFNNILPRVVDSLNPAIDYWESSPKYGRGDKRFYTEGDAHDWWVWHDGYPFEHFEHEVPRFMSEFGFQSFPTYEMIQYFTELDSIDISHPSFESHQKHNRGYGIIKEYMERDFPVPNRDEDYVYMSQLVQAYGITKGIEAHRRAKPYNMGTLYWQLNDCWPAVSWSSIDGLGNWKALHFKAKKAFEDVLLSPVYEDEILKISVVNDLFDSITGPLELTITDFNGEVKFKTSLEITSPSNSSQELFEQNIDWLNLDPKSTVLHLTFQDISRLYYFVKPKDLRLQSSEISSKITKNKEGFSVRLSSETLQKDVFLFSSEKGNWSDNFFDLPPGIEKIIQFNTTVQDFNLEIKTLNQFTQK